MPFAIMLSCSAGNRSDENVMSPTSWIWWTVGSLIKRIKSARKEKLTMQCNQQNLIVAPHHDMHAVSLIAMPAASWVCDSKCVTCKPDNCKSRVENQLAQCIRNPCLHCRHQGWRQFWLTFDARCSFHRSTGEAAAPCILPCPG